MRGSIAAAASNQAPVLGEVVERDLGPFPLEEPDPARHPVDDLPVHRALQHDGQRRQDVVDALVCQLVLDQFALEPLDALVADSKTDLAVIRIEPKAGSRCVRNTLS